jgi:hypothetical protein
MKDAKGHGSNGRGNYFGPPPGPQTKTYQARQAMKAAKNPDSWENRYGTQADRDYAMAHAINDGVDAGFKSARALAGIDGAAARALASGPKSAPAPVHDSMRSSEEDEYNRDLRLRIRNGQVGSGMKFRG